MKNFRIKYECYNALGHLIKHGEIKAKNKPNEFMAKVGLEDYFKKSLPEFTKLVILSCKEENIMDEFFRNYPFPKFK